MIFSKTYLNLTNKSYNPAMGVPRLFPGEGNNFPGVEGQEPPLSPLADAHDSSVENFVFFLE
jgi:hypothetical protein